MLWAYVVSRVADIGFVHWKRHRKRNRGKHTVATLSDGTAIVFNHSSLSLVVVPPVSFSYGRGSTSTNSPSDFVPNFWPVQGYAQCRGSGSTASDEWWWDELHVSVTTLLGLWATIAYLMAV